jgi:hypothetical protein
VYRRIMPFSPISWYALHKNLLDLLVSFSPIAQPEDGPIKGPKHVVVSLVLH